MPISLGHNLLVLLAGPSPYDLKLASSPHGFWALISSRHCVPVISLQQLALSRKGQQVSVSVINQTAAMGSTHNRRPYDAGIHGANHTNSHTAHRKGHANNFQRCARSGKVRIAFS